MQHGSQTALTPVFDAFAGISQNDVSVLIAILWRSIVSDGNIPYCSICGRCSSFTGNCLIPFRPAPLSSRALTFNGCHESLSGYSEPYIG